MKRVKRAKIRWSLLLGASLALGAVAGAGAAERAGKFDLGAFLGGYVFDRDLKLANAPAVGARLGYFVTNRFEPELSVEAVRTNNASAHDPASLQEGHLDLLYHVGNWAHFEPYVAAGAGLTRYQKSDSDWDYAVNFGGGVKYWFTDDLAARLDLRRPVTFDSRERNFLWTVGISWLLGGAPVPAPVPAPTASLTANPASILRGETTTLSWTTQNASEVAIDGLGTVGASGSQAVTPKDSTNYRLTAKGAGGTVVAAVAAVAVAAPADSDGDGVTDDRDKCAATPAGVTVDGSGCPLDSDKDGVADYLDKCPGTPEGVTVDALGCPLDSDKDGVADYLDKCPGTPAGVSVDGSGCPLDSDKDGVADSLDKCPGTPEGVTVDGSGCPLDTDKDGVADYLDKCPGTPAGVTVDALGCQLDTDKDGVADSRDKCPNTPHGMKVDPEGCSIEKLRVTLKIEFDTDKDVIKPQYHDELAKLGDFMKKYPQVHVVIEGHTDNVGNEAYNKKLSQRRAEAVSQYLTEKFGIAASRLSSAGFGPSKPLGDNGTPEGRALNRRTEAVADEVIIKK